MKVVKLAAAANAKDATMAFGNKSLWTEQTDVLDSMRTSFITFAFHHNNITTLHFHPSGAVCAWKTGKRKMEAGRSSASHQRKREHLQAQRWKNQIEKVSNGQRRVQALGNTLRYLATLCLDPPHVHAPAARPRSIGTLLAVNAEGSRTFKNM